MLFVDWWFYSSTEVASRGIQKILVYWEVEGARGIMTKLYDMIEEAMNEWMMQGLSSQAVYFNESRFLSGV